MRKLRHSGTCVKKKVIRISHRAMVFATVADDRFTTLSRLKKRASILSRGARFAGEVIAIKENLHMNKVCLIGNLGKDIELKHTNSGLATCTFDVGVARPKNKNGESETDWIRCVAWDKTAELCDRYIGKGSKVGVDGHLQARVYDDKDGRKVKVVEVVVDRIDFLSKSNGANTNADEPAADATPATAPTQYNDDELPF